MASPWEQLISQAQNIPPRTEAQPPQDMDEMMVQVDENGTIMGSPMPASQVQSSQSMERTQRTKRMGPASQEAVSREMLEDDLINNLRMKGSELINQEQQGIGQLEENVNQMRRMPTGVDWSPAAAYIDSIVEGSRLTPVAQAMRPETPAQKAEKLLMLQDRLQQRKNDLTKQQYENLKNELAARKKEKNPLDDYLKLAKIDAYKRGEMDSLLPGQKRMDSKVGEDLADWSAGGGYATFDKNLNALRGAVDILNKDPSLTGGAGSLLPETLGIKAKLAPERMALKQQVYQAVQASLKAVMGTQFTEKEGESFMARSYDDNLPAAKNIEKLNAAILELATKGKQKEESAKYFEKTRGTLKGYQPTTDRTEKYKPGQVVDGYKFMGGDWKDQNNWEAQ